MKKKKKKRKGTPASYPQLCGVTVAQATVRVPLAEVSSRVERVRRWMFIFVLQSVTGQFFGYGQFRPEMEFRITSTGTLSAIRLLLENFRSFNLCFNVHNFL